MAPTTKSGFGRAKLRGAREHAAPVTTRVKGQAKTQVFRVAGVQMASGPNVAANLNEAGRLIEIAVQQGARLVALPEYFAIMLGTERFAEEGTLEAGKHVKVADSPFGRIGLSVCYDLRFPELYGRETHGDSMVVDPWGTVLDRLPRGSGVVIASVNPAYQASLRKSLPALTHRVIHRI